jgi:hypothetical protein
MACRRVLSKGFGNRWRQRGIETYKQELQLIQVARIWQAGRGASIAFIGVYTDGNIVMGAESADFFFDCWYLRVIKDDGILYVPGGIHY